MCAIFIESKTNPTFRQCVRLLNAHERRKTGLFLIEGFRELTRALQASIEIESFVFKKSVFEAQNRVVQTTFGPHIKTYNCFILADNLFKQLSLREHDDGILALAKRSVSDFPNFELKSHGLYLLVEHLEKPGNLGAVARSVEAVAADGLLVADPCVDLWNPHVIRTSQGAIFNIKTFVGTSEALYEKLAHPSVHIFATTPGAQTSYWEADMTSACVLCIGNEAKGLTSFWLERATPIAIPMFGASADSLNASVAATLCLYEAKRQRDQSNQPIQS